VASQVRRPDGEPIQVFLDHRLDSEASGLVLDFTRSDELPALASAFIRTHRVHQQMGIGCAAFDEACMVRSLGLGHLVVRHLMKLAW